MQDKDFKLFKYINKRTDKISDVERCGTDLVFVVYRDVPEERKTRLHKALTPLELAEKYKHAEFSFEDEAAHYCDYRNAMCEYHCTDALNSIHPIRPSATYDVKKTCHAIRGHNFDFVKHKQ